MTIPKLSLYICSVLLSMSASSALAETPSSDEARQRIGVSEHEILIGSCNPQSGQLSERGLQLLIGANSAFDAVNDEGGINGRKIKLVVCDDKYDPDAAILCFNTCLKDKVFAGAFFVGSPPISKYVRMGEADELPLLAFCTGTPTVYGHSYWRFVLRPGYQDEVARQIDQLWKAGLRKIAVVYQNDAFGAAIRQNAIRALSERQSAPVAEASYSRNATEIDEAYKRIKEANPEVVLVGATTHAFKAMVQKHAEDNWPVLFSGFSVDTDFAVELGKLSDGVILTRAKFIAALQSLHDFDTGAGKEFRVNFSAANHRGLSSDAVYFVVMKNGKPTPLSQAQLNALLKR